MTEFAETFNVTTPAASADPRETDDRIREAKAAVQEREDVDHFWGKVGNTVDGANVGKHRRVVFYGPLSADPTLAAGEFGVYTKTVGGKSELFVADADGHVKQVTTGGKLNIANADLALITAFTLAVNFPLGLTVGQDTDIGNYNLRAKTLQSDVAAGTAPLIVASTTKVTNLDADTVDGYHPHNMFGGLSAVDKDGAAFGNNGVYRAACDGEVIFYGLGSADHTITGYVGTANPPTNVVAHFHPTGVVYDARSFRVAKNEYFKVVGTDPPTSIWWRSFTGGSDLPTKQA